MRWGGSVESWRAPRLLAIMGSGETSPTMVGTHRELFGPQMRAELAVDLGQRPRLPADASGQVGAQGGEAELSRSGGQALLGAATPVLGGQLRLWRRGEVGLGEQAADGGGGGVEFLGQLGEAGVLAARRKVAVEAGEAQLDDVVVEAAALAVDDRDGPRRVHKCVHAARRYSWRSPPSRSRRWMRPRWSSSVSVGPVDGAGGFSSSARCGRWAL